MLLEENKSLAPFTTFGIGGPARWFAQAESENEVVEAAAWARQRRVTLFVLGGGSNLLVSDHGFEGLVLHLALRGVEPGVAGAQAIYRVAAGEEWDRFVARAVTDNCAGVECLAGIPGSVGGTPVQNVGAYGQEVASSIERVRGFDLREETFVEFSAAACAFAYRRSRFNTTDRGRYVITRVDYRLTKNGRPTLGYADLQRLLREGTNATVGQVADQVRDIRRSKGMLLVKGDPDCRSAGSFFKNPIVGRDQMLRIADATRQEPPCFPAGTDPEYAGCVKIPAAWLIERSGFAKGYQLGAAGISSRHTLALINRGGAQASEILALADQILAAVESRFGIRLEREPEMVGF